MRPLRSRRFGIQAEYVDGLGRRRRAPREAVAAVRRILAEAEPASLVDPVAIAWDGEGAAVRVAAASGRVSVEIELEDGTSLRRRAEIRDGAIHLPGGLPLGYHRASVQSGRASGEVLVVSAPRRAPETDGRLWGLFLPLYAARSEPNWGAGNFTDLGDLLRDVAGRGGHLVATLPMLAGFYDEPFDPSPYAPASRLFWSEFFLDVERVPELHADRAAARLVASREFRDEIDRLRAGRLVDYRAGMALRRRALEACLAALGRTPGRRAAFETFLEAHPETGSYAAFRARTERIGPWRDWPVSPPAPDPERAAYHAYVQFLCAEQLDALGRTAADAGASLYLDMPLGVHPAGFDVWRYRDLFAEGVSTGAPPDSFFTGGQDWTNPPLVPGSVRSSGYAYPRACLATLLGRAGVVRIDHIIGLHRTYWIPEGFGPSEGVFVRWPAPEEWYAILALEAHRAGAIVVGEDLGTVPPEVRRAMARHGILRSYVQQEEFDARGKPNPVPARSLAAINTHDMPTFRGFLEGRDIAERVAAGLLDERGAARERKRRSRRIEGLRRELAGDGFAGGDLLGDALARLAASPARIVLASVGDLLGDRAPQNRPGTTGKDNWRRKEGKPIESLDEVPRLMGRLEQVTRQRNS